MMHRDGSRDAHPEDEACEEEVDCSWLITYIFPDGKVSSASIGCVREAEPSPGEQS